MGQNGFIQVGPAEETSKEKISNFMDTLENFETPDTVTYPGRFES